MTTQSEGQFFRLTDMGLRPRTPAEGQPPDPPPGPSALDPLDTPRSRASTRRIGIDRSRLAAASRHLPHGAAPTVRRSSGRSLHERLKPQIGPRSSVVGRRSSVVGRRSAWSVCTALAAQAVRGRARLHDRGTRKTRAHSASGGSGARPAAPQGIQGGALGRGS